jgi:hypothetical protein
MDSGQLETEGLVTILAEMSTPPSTQTAGTVPRGTIHTINGVMIKIRDTAAVVIRKMILHKMQNRNAMLSDKLAQLFVKATRVQHTKNDFISLLIDDQDKLDHTYMTGICRTCPPHFFASRDNRTFVQGSHPKKLKNKNHILKLVTVR